MLRHFTAFVCTACLFACSGESDQTPAGDDGAGGASGGNGGSAGSIATGGAGPSGGTGQGGDEGGAAGTAGSCTDPLSATRHGQRARSSGFSGTDAEYAELYEESCTVAADCVEPCTTRGGTESMCEASACIDSTTDYCLPATVWRNTAALRSEGTLPVDGAELVLVSDPYEDFLLVDDFKLEVPESADVTGITVTIRRAGGSPAEAADGAVRLVKGGVVGDSDRALATPWPGPEYVDVDYGGPADSWGDTWTPVDVNSPDFGVALSALYTRTDGSGRAYVDIVYATVHYRTACEETGGR
jgi:hypothetical protein